jgi:hypothetical protein
MAPEIPLEGQRPADFVFDGLVKRLSVEREERASQRRDAA